MLLRIRTVSMALTAVCVSVVHNDWTELDCSCEVTPEELQEHLMVAYQVGFYPCHLDGFWWGAEVALGGTFNVNVSMTA
jgi:hypothetical protein